MFNKMWLITILTGLLTVYIDMGNQATDSVNLAFTFTTTSATRNWEIKVTQIECSNPGRQAPT